MNRRQFINGTSALFGSLLLPIDVLKKWIRPGQEYIIREVRDSVHIFLERGGTIAWMADKKGTVVIDTQFREQAGHLIEEIQKKSVRQVDLLMNTHHHRDHTMGNIAFKGLAKRVVAHKNSVFHQRRVAEENGLGDQQFYPEEVFDTRWEAPVGNENIRAYYYGAAHTSGDAVIHFENANVVHMGDLVFNRRYPYIDMDAGASIQGWIQVLDKTLGQFDDNTLFIFGHAREPYDVIGGKDDLRAMQNYLSALLEFGRESWQSGIPFEQFLENKYIPGATEWEGEGIERSLRAVWEEVGVNR